MFRFRLHDTILVVLVTLLFIAFLSFAIYAEKYGKYTITKVEDNSFKQDTNKNYHVIRDNNGIILLKKTRHPDMFTKDTIIVAVSNMGNVKVFDTSGKIIYTGNIYIKKQIIKNKKHDKQTK